MTDIMEGMRAEAIPQSDVSPEKVQSVNKVGAEAVKAMVKYDANGYLTEAPKYSELHSPVKPQVQKISWHEDAPFIA